MIDIPSFVDFILLQELAKNVDAYRLSTYIYKDKESVDNRLLNAEVQRRRLEIDTLKWTLARIQPYGLRDKKDEPSVAVDNSITLSWDNGEVKVG